MIRTSGTNQKKIFGYRWVPGNGEKKILGTDEYQVPAGQIFLGTDGYRVTARKFFGYRGVLGTGQIFNCFFRCFSSDSRPSPENFLSLLGKDHTLNLAKKIQIYTMYRLLRSEVIPQPVARSGVTKCVNRSGFRPIGRI